MSPSQIKLKYIFGRFILVEVIFVGVYTLFNQFYYIPNNWLRHNENITNLIVPLIISIIPVLLFVHPRIKLLLLEKRRGQSPLAGYIMLATFAFIAILCSSQFYLSKALGKLTPLNRITDVRKLPASKYYTVKQRYIDQHDHYIYQSNEVTGKNRSTLNFYYAVVCPVYDVAADTAKSNASDADKMWLGTFYSDNISNRKSAGTKDSAEIAFQEGALQQFKQANVNRFIYLERLGSSTRKRDYTKALTLPNAAENDDLIIFEAHNQPFSQHTGNSLWWMLLAFVAGNGFILIMIMAKPLDQQKVAEVVPPDPGKWTPPGTV